jgi:3-hydroxymyristoyl/3-hydroxydecanoyl-(acyl carrier protein) dehydratase
MISENILSFIPQRYPFVMVDTLLFADEKTTRTGFTVTAGNIFFEENVFSEAGLMENIAQTAAAGAGYRESQANKPAAIGYIGAVKNFEVFVLPELNDILTTEAVITDKIFNATIIKGKIMCDTLLVARCEMKVFIVSGE